MGVHLFFFLFPLVQLPLTKTKKSSGLPLVLWAARRTGLKFLLWGFAGGFTCDLNLIFV